MSGQTFQDLKNLPVPFSNTQCVLHKQEILICGGYTTNKCYSYHISKNKYKYICDYPSNVRLFGHCVVKLVDNNNKDDDQITLLSFGGYYEHTLSLLVNNVKPNLKLTTNIDQSKISFVKIMQVCAVFLLLCSVAFINFIILCLFHMHLTVSTETHKLDISTTALNKEY
ncbi:hypothetical protein RFI_31007 [Reticulomyxa filosa]|uniref:Uncharacterized protein n=1 Tax=Reticulomyxa filosa TaxID=46433 RepID=X6LYJ0_RETFI|nr:hypothetical protein RFI_31007 [Reticulomyxa filosa]|eukprot:ETO06391.1 hypothetical protein RFI_31007 [Reticulomyxa filosa]